MVKKMDLEQQFEKEFTVSQYECDLNNRMKASAIMRQVQQVSTDHCNAVGITNQTYEQTHTAFLLAKISLEVNREVKVGDRLKLTTTPSYPVRAVYHRFTTLSFADTGEEAASMDSRWILVDINTRRILRKPPEEFHFPFLAPVGRTHDLTITKADTLYPVGEECIRYSKIDQNRHLNNTEYADLICDRFPTSVWENGFVRKLVIDYRHEVKLEETLALYASQPMEQSLSWPCYWKGMVGETTCFEASVCF